MRLAAIVILAIVLVASAASSQSYPVLQPVPRTTDPAALHRLANQREILERIRIGFAASERADWNAAAAEFERAIALHPGEPQASTAYYDLGIARAGLREYAGAAAAFEEAIARDSGFLAARANLVAVNLLRDNLVAARAAADAFVAVAPESARALYSRGLISLKAGDAATAVADFAKLSAGEPAYAVAHYDLALAERQLGRFADAERELRTAIQLAPAYARAHIALGAVLLHEGKRDEARSAFDAAADAAKDVAMHNLAVSLRDAVVRP